MRRAQNRKIGHFLAWTVGRKKLTREQSSVLKGVVGRGQEVGKRPARELEEPLSGSKKARGKSLGEGFHQEPRVPKRRKREYTEASIAPEAAMETPAKELFRAAGSTLKPNGSSAGGARQEEVKPQSHGASHSMGEKRGKRRITPIPSPPVSRPVSAESSVIRNEGPDAEEASQQSALVRDLAESFSTVSTDEKGSVAANQAVPWRLSEAEEGAPSGSGPPPASQTRQAKPVRIRKPPEADVELDPRVEEALRYLGTTFGDIRGGQPVSGASRRRRKARRWRKWRRFCGQLAFWPSKKWYLGFTEQLAKVAEDGGRVLGMIDRWRVEQLRNFGRDHLADAALGMVGVPARAAERGPGDANAHINDDEEVKPETLSQNEAGAKEDFTGAKGSEIGLAGQVETEGKEELAPADVRGHPDEEEVSSSGMDVEDWGALEEDAPLEGASDDDCTVSDGLSELGRDEPAHASEAEGQPEPEVIHDRDLAEGDANELHMDALRSMRLMTQDAFWVLREGGGGEAWDLEEGPGGPGSGGAEADWRTDDEGGGGESQRQGENGGGPSDLAFMTKMATAESPSDLEAMLDRLGLEDLALTAPRPVSCRPLSAAESTAVDAVLRRSFFRGGDDGHGIVASVGQHEVSARDLQALSGARWLNDQVVNFYMELLARKNAADRKAARARPVPRVHVLNSFFYTKLVNGGYNYTGVRRWTKRVDVFQQDLLLTPINLNNAHWALISVNLKDRCVEYYDSLCGPVESARARTITETVLRYLEDESQDKRQRELEDRKKWAVKQMLHGVPQQGDGGSCGVFACAYADLLAQGARPPFDFSQADILTMRRAMAADILAGKLQPA
ncbi:hypothetical protein KFL_002500100 [Klebsormidium nitens]|uniref:Ubiquitin-like protease family profile domain-containing protein n=1 Tax=Klebsormidium nitens TaxID=105231 RepID=A0A1Y1I708_KLENI|nr:hypothetical protein KFL_002500100 [Klebsormidium nitens]|eukprot:GAQ85712.1 hypothetical protein KFL_002500100 [Klebsormidium nitens]